MRPAYLQVVRVHDPDDTWKDGRVYRAGSARPTRPLITGRPVSAGPAYRSTMVRADGPQCFVF